jgi:hypothetical protein
VNLSGLARFGAFALTCLAVVAIWNMVSGHRPVLTERDPIVAVFAAAIYSIFMHFKRKQPS